MSATASASTVTAARTSRVFDLETALGDVRDGMTIGIGGFINSGHPTALIRALIRRGAGDLTIIGAASAGLEVDLLIASGLVRKVVTPYVGAEGLAAVGPAFRRAAEHGEIEVWELDEAHHYAGLRAAAQRLPFNPWRAGIGTSIPEVNPDIKVFRDPISDQPMLAIPALSMDLCLIHAACSDPFGNAQHNGNRYGDQAMFAAADRTVVQVEMLVSNEQIRRQPDRTTIPGADAVTRTLFGAHPFSSDGHYTVDEAHIRTYLDAAGAYAKSGDRAQLDDYLEQFVLGPTDHLEYLERIGIRRLASLSEY